MGHTKHLPWPLPSHRERSYDSEGRLLPPRSPRQFTVDEEL